jgi:hypothetical protein
MAVFQILVDRENIGLILENIKFPKRGDPDGDDFHERAAG